MNPPPLRGTEETLALRVAVAHDVLKQLDYERYVASPRSYHEFLDEADDGLDLRGARCEVCAQGAATVSVLRVLDRPEADFIAARALARDIFGEEMFEQMEAAFEGYWPAGEWYALAGDNPDENLREIMNNIIRNRGAFVLADLPSDPREHDGE